MAESFTVLHHKRGPGGQRNGSTVLAFNAATCAAVPGTCIETAPGNSVLQCKLYHIALSACVDRYSHCFQLELITLNILQEK